MISKAGERNRLTLVKDLVQAGLCTLPADLKEKRPALRGWKEYQHRLPTDEELNRWFADDRPLCLVTGSVSGNLEMIDFDLGGEFFEPWLHGVREADPALPERLVIERSQSGGRHVVYRCEEPVDGNMRLAQRQHFMDCPDEVMIGGKAYRPRKGPDGRWHVLLTLIETRGEGGLFLCAPTPGYELLQGEFTRLPVLTATERDTLLQAAWSLNEYWLAAPESCQGAAPGESRPGDEFNERGDVRELLRRHGWELVREGENEYWRRPGKDGGSSATLKDRIFFVFSTNAEPFEPDRAYSPFAVYSLLEHGGDFAAAAAALRTEGYGSDPATPRVEPVVDLSGILGASPDIDTSKEAKDPGPFPEYVLNPPGLLAEIVEYNLSTAQYPEPIMAVAGALALMGTVAGRKIQDYQGTRTNVYFLVLAPSGTGKDQARRINKRILTQANCLELLGPDRISSHAGILSQLDEHPVKLFQPDEFHATISAAVNSRHSPHLKHIPETLKEAYSACGEIWLPTSYGDRRNNFQIIQPHLVLYSVATPDELWEAMTPEFMRAGYMGRNILIDVPDSMRPPEDHGLAPVPQSIVEQLQWWKAFSPGGNLTSLYSTPAVLEMSPEAKDRLFSHAKAIRERQMNNESIARALWNRTAQKAAQLALIFAASRQSFRSQMCIELDDAERAVRLANWSTRKAIYLADRHMAEGEHHKLVLRVLSKIPFDKSLTASELTRRTQFCKRHEREAIIADLLEARRIQVEQNLGKTKPVTKYRRIS